MKEVEETIKQLKQNIETCNKLIENQYRVIEDYERLFGILRRDFPEAWKALHRALHEMQSQQIA